MCVNHSRLQFFSLTAPAGVFASGADANAAMAETMAARAESNGASASEPRGFPSPTSGPAASRSATPADQPGQVTTPGTPGGATSPTQSPGARVGVRQLVGDSICVGAPTSGTVPSARTSIVPTDSGPADSTDGIRVAIRLAAGHAPAPLPAPAKPATTLPYSTRLSATPLVETTSTATRPVATGSVATDPVATRSHEHATCRSTLLAS